MTNKGLYFFEMDFIRGEKGESKIGSIAGFHTTDNYRISSVFNETVDESDYAVSLNKVLAKFENWVKNPYYSKFIMFRNEDMKFLIDEAKKYQYKAKVRDFFKIIGYQGLNIRSEMIYRLGLKKKNVSLSELLSIYGLHYVGEPNLAKDRCFNMLSLVNHFKTDENRNGEVFSKKERNRITPVMNLSVVRKTGEEKLLQKMREGWNINIECKANGREFGMSYEARAYNINIPATEQLFKTKVAYGETLEELMDNLFAEDVLNV